MVARSLVGLAAVVAVVALALAASPSPPATQVVAANLPTERENVDSEFRRVVQGEVLSVSDEGRELEAAITLQWAPQVSAVDERARFRTNRSTRVSPTDGGLASLRPGDPVQIVAMPRDAEGWHAVEVTILDID